MSIVVGTGDYSQIKQIADALALPGAQRTVFYSNILLGVPTGYSLVIIDELIMTRNAFFVGAPGDIPHEFFTDFPNAIELTSFGQIDSNTFKIT